MLTANEAYFEALNGKKIIEIKSQIEEEVLKSVKEGMLWCQVYPSVSISDEIKERIIKELTDLGYKVEIDNNDKNYDCIIVISWNIKKE